MTETVADTRDRRDARERDSNRAEWLRMTRISCWLIALWAVMLNLLAGEPIVEVLVIGLVFGILGVYVRKERRKLGLLTAILGVVALSGNLPGTIDELAHPSSAPAFILTLLVVMAALGVIISGIAGFLGVRAVPIRAVGFSGAVLFGVGILVALSAAASVESIEPQPSDVRVVARGVAFEPTRIVVPPGDTGFWLDNQDGIRHTFTIAGTGHVLDAPASTSQRADFDLPPGSYEVFCEVPGHENMKIRLIVEAGA